MRILIEQVLSLHTIPQHPSLMDAPPRPTGHARGTRICTLSKRPCQKEVRDRGSWSRIHSHQRQHRPLKPYRQHLCMSTWVHANPAPIPLPPAPTHFLFLWQGSKVALQVHLSSYRKSLNVAGRFAATRTDIVGLQIPWVALRRFFTPKIESWRASNGPSNSSRQSLGCGIAYCKVPRNYHKSGDMN